MATSSAVSSERVAMMVRDMYGAPSNETRLAATNTLMFTVQSLTGEQLLSVGLDLLQTPQHLGGPQTMAVRAYGAVLLKQSICAEKITAAAVNASTLLSWIAYDSSVAPIVRHSVTNLIVACAVRLWPEQWPEFIPTVCPPTDLVNQPQLLPLLQQFCDACIDTSSLSGANGGGSSNGAGGVELMVPGSRYKALREGMRRDAKSMLSTLIQAMFSWYSAQQWEPLRLAVGVMSTLCSATTAAVWWELGVHEVLDVLWKAAPVAKEAYTCAGALVRHDSILNVPYQQQQKGTIDPTTAVFLQKLVKVDDVFARGDMDALQEVLEVALDLSPPLLNLIRLDVGALVDRVLSIPSVLFATYASELYKRVMSVSSASPITTSASGMLSNIFFLCQKHKTHPSFMRSPSTRASGSGLPGAAPADGAKGIIMSQEQFSTLQAFDVAYAEMRGNLSSMLSSLAQYHASEAASFVISVLRMLPTERYSYDPTTSGGHVQQHSQAFSEWQASQFVMEQLVPVAFARPEAEDVARECLEQLDIHKTQDAVLVPVFLNMIAAFWPPSKHWSASLQIQLWRWSVDVIFTYMHLRVGIIAQRLPPHVLPLEDPDLISARKRAFTVFIHAAVNHGKTVVSVPNINLLERCQEKLLSSSTLLSEKALLYEAVASLSNEMSAEEQAAFLDSIVGPMCEIIVNSKVESLATIICGQTLELSDQRSLLRDSVGVLAAILRRCNPSPYMTNLVMRVLPTLGNMVLQLHSMTPEQVPAEFREIFEMSQVDRNQFLTGCARKTDTSRNTAVNKARSAYQQLRLSLYQAIGSIGSFVALESYSNALAQTVASCGSFEIFTMRAFCEQVLFRWMKTSPLTAMFTLPSIRAFFDAQNIKPRTAEMEVVDSKQLFYFTKDVLVAIGSITDTNDWEKIPVMCSEVSLLLASLMRSAFEPRATVNFIVKLLETNQLDATVAMDLFGVAAVSCVTSPRIATRDQEPIAGQLCSVYTRNATIYGEALQRCGIPQKTVAELNGSLTIAPRIDIKRRLFRDFLLKAATPSSK